MARVEGLEVEVCRCGGWTGSSGEVNLGKGCFGRSVGVGRGCMILYWHCGANLVVCDYWDGLC
jgi:hypothetical protein